jgi:hypothetical protein
LQPTHPSASSSIGSLFRFNTISVIPDFSFRKQILIQIQPNILTLSQFISVLTSQLIQAFT